MAEAPKTYLQGLYTALEACTAALMEHANQKHPGKDHPTLFLAMGKTAGIEKCREVICNLIDEAEET